MNNIDQFLMVADNLGIRKKSLSNEEVTNYFAIPNIERAKWLIPFNSICQKKCSLLIYQPVNLKGKLLREVICLCPDRLISIFAKKRIIKLHVNDFVPIDGYKDGNNCYTFFLGTDGVHKKTTIQLSNGVDIKLYIKISIKPDIIALFDNERRVLGFLNKTELASNIPEIISYTNIKNLVLIAFSTTKKISSAYCNRLNNKHIEFLLKLYNCGDGGIFNNNSEYYIKINTQLDEYIKRYPCEQWMRQTLENAVDNIFKAKAQIVPIHHDFTFWNIYFNDESIFVFDWEYALMDGLPFYDALHFIIQPLILDDVDSKKIKNQILKNKYLYKYASAIGINQFYIKAFVIMYLMDIIFLYEFRSEQISSNDQQTNDRRKKLLREFWSDNCGGQKY